MPWPGGCGVIRSPAACSTRTGASRRPWWPACAGSGSRWSGRHPRDGREVPSASSCFDRLGTHEIAWQGRKLVGSAQVRRHRGFLQHGSLPRSLPPERLGAVLGEPVRPERFVDLARALGRAPSDQEIDRALIAGFEEAFGCAFEEDALTEAERRAAELLARTKYGLTRFLLRRSVGRTRRGVGGGVRHHHHAQQGATVCGE